MNRREWLLAAAASLASGLQSPGKGVKATVVENHKGKSLLPVRYALWEPGRAGIRIPGRLRFVFRPRTTFERVYLFGPSIQ